LQYEGGFVSVVFVSATFFLFMFSVFEIEECEEECYEAASQH
jgi:hypothetical protein